ncbi:MAG: polyphosphate:AMP phosphotransferase [Gemmatimonadetes bacterium]|nr:polyphosphate:AMP phosphotransferase [Gemmatimonadota bacterium]NNM07135.1 polyphosphate:AMP phosphotransferase [Gemmatimonadota bacterium]
MFETAELGQKVSKATYKEREILLRQELLDAQFRLKKAGFPVIVLFHGVDGAGKGDTVNTLHEWMDTRLITTQAYDRPTTEEAERPTFWRYWRDLPASGRTGVFLKAWYSGPFLKRVYGETTQDNFDHDLSRILAFERTLAVDGAVILKFWLHLGKKQQKKAFQALESDPAQAWRVTKKDWEHWKRYEDFVPVAEHLIMRTSTGSAPWRIIEGFDARFRNLEVGTALLNAIRRGLAAKENSTQEGSSNGPSGSSGRSREKDLGDQGTETAVLEPTLAAPAPKTTILSTLDMEKRLKKSEYRKALSGLHGRLFELRRTARKGGVSMILLFEGWDAAGKGGAIRRVVRELDARFYEVIAVGAPTEEERAHHYLWRFWRHVPRAGRVAIFDRSWYGRVLVERIEGFAGEREWRRAYAEINDFEAELVGHGVVLKKFWIHITPEEQELRFKARAEDPLKSWKLTEEDWRNRDRWEAYERAVSDMVERTSTQNAPWVLIEGNDKRHARVRVLDEVCTALERAL